MRNQKTRLFRAITPLLSCLMPPNSGSITCYEGEVDGDSFKVELVEVSGYKEAMLKFLEPWSCDEEAMPGELVFEIANTSRGNCYLVVDHCVEDTNETRIKVNTIALVNIHGVAEKTMMLFWDCLGPYSGTTWMLQSPFFAQGASQKLVSMNDFLCTKTTPSSGFHSEFDNVFGKMMKASWKDTQFGNVLDLSLELISNSLRALKPAYSFVFLALAFETLFAKTDKDWSGASRRMARLIGRSKSEVTKIHKTLDDGSESVRQLRNDLVHGTLSADLKKVSEIRSMFAPWLANSIIYIINEFNDYDKYNDYYDEIERIAEDRFFDLPNQN